MRAILPTAMQTRIITVPAFTICRSQASRIDLDGSRPRDVSADNDSPVRFAQARPARNTRQPEQTSLLTFITSLTGCRGYLKSCRCQEEEQGVEMEVSIQHQTVPLTSPSECLPISHQRHHRF